MKNSILIFYLPGYSTTMIFCCVKLFSKRTTKTLRNEDSQSNFSVLLSLPYAGDIPCIVVLPSSIELLQYKSATQGTMLKEPNARNIVFVLINSIFKDSFLHKRMCIEIPAKISFQKK